MTGSNDGTQVTLDHVINKARHPELLFDYKNLEAICRSCNAKKGDDNTFAISQVVKQRDQEASEHLAQFSKI
ncbi:MAG: HNH endonuclease [Acaryochloris sp. RU_4_1]|nr:HNH endonuclease [Acaryochloris sp. RU_4_1]NJR53357.1 HNH endonuclease [Acaryochloris sp. CRU_2_0]